METLGRPLKPRHSLEGRGLPLWASTLWPGDKGQGVCRNWVQKCGGLAGTVWLGYGKGARLRHRLRAS